MWLFLRIKLEGTVARTEGNRSRPLVALRWVSLATRKISSFVTSRRTSVRRVLVISICREQIGPVEKHKSQVWKIYAETKVCENTPTETLSPLLSFLVHLGLLEEEENFYHQTPTFSPIRHPPQHHLLHHPHHHCPKLKRRWLDQRPYACGWHKRREELLVLVCNS